MVKKFLFLPALMVGLCALAMLAGCVDDAQVVSQNISRAADNFEINRRIVFYNGITNENMLEIAGACSIGSGTETKSVTVTCNTGPGRYKKHFLGLSDNVTYFAEQIDDAKVSKYFYRVTFKPSVIIPAIDIR